MYTFCYAQIVFQEVSVDQTNQRQRRTFQLRREGMNGWLLFLGNSRDQTLIKANEKLCATMYSRAENVCVFLFGGGCCAFSLRNTWYGLEFPSYRDFDTVLVLS